MHPDFYYTLGAARVAVFGNQSRINDDPTISYNQALALGASRGKIAQLIVASDHTMPGHKGVYPAIYESPQYWDGAVIHEAGAAIIFQTADCPAVVVADKTNQKRLAAFHAGRPALSPEGHCASCTVVGNGLHALVGNASKGSLEALVVGNICGSCFKHDTPEAQRLLLPFYSYPEQVFADREVGALDLYEVIRHELVCHGVSSEQIHHEGPCTFETPTLASYRRNKTKLRNTVIVVLQ